MSQDKSQRHRERSLHAPNPPPLSRQPVREDEIYHLIIDPELRRHLRETHEAAMRHTCHRCVDDLKDRGLPYRTVLRCTHGGDQS